MIYDSQRPLRGRARGPLAAEITRECLLAEALIERGFEAWEVAFDDVECPLGVDPGVFVGDEVAQAGMTWKLALSAASPIRSGVP